MEEKFRATVMHLVPEIWTIIVSGILAVLIMESKVEVQVITSFPETPSGATMNMALFVAVMAVMATVMYLLVRYGLERLFRSILKVAIVLVLFVLLTWYFTAFAAVVRIPDEYVDVVVLVSSVALTSVMAYAIHRLKGAPHLLSVTFLGAMVGTFLGASVPTLTTVVLLLGLACYDVFAVFKGPIGKIAEKTDLETLSGATLTFGDLTVGLGDLVFYSMLASHSLLSFGVVSYAVASVGIVIGTFLGFKMLERRSTFPGLPLSLLSGLGFMLITVYLQHGSFPW